MERLEIPDKGEVSEWTEAVRRGDEVVIVRDGTVVAEIRARTAEAPANVSKLVDLVGLRAIHARFPSANVADATALVREMRDMDDH